MGDCSRAYGDGYYGDCLYGGADVTIPGYISFPGTNGNVLLVPHQPEWQLDGDVTLLVEVRVPVWGSGNVDVLLAQRGSSSTVAWWDLRITGAGFLQTQMNEGLGGSSIAVTLGSAAEMTAAPAGEWVTLAVVVRPNVAGNCRLRAYWSTDGMQTWTPISGVKGGTAFSIPAAQPLSIGAHSTGNNGLVGDLRFVSFCRGSNGDLPGGTPIFEFNGTEITDPDATSFVAVSGQTVDVSRGDTPLVIYPAIPGDCTPCYSSDPCPQQIPPASSHMDRWDEMVPCPPGGNC